MGIPGFDEMVGGGIPYKSAIELAGTPGSGKTIFAMQYLVQGAMQGERGLYFTFEQRKEDMIETFASFGWDLPRLESEGKIKIVFKAPVEEDGLMDSFRLLKLEEEYQNFPAHRVVFDSVNVLNIFSPDWKKTRRSLVDFVYYLKDKGATSIFITEREQGIKDGFCFLPLDFLFDGLIFLDNVEINGILKNVVVIPKMRNVNHDKGMRPLRITPDGIVVDPTGKIYSE